MTNQLFLRDGAEHTGVILTNAKGRPYFMARSACSRCGGTPMVSHPSWGAFNNGLCFDCNGTGQGPNRPHKLYTAEQIAKMNATRDRRTERKVAAAEAKAAQDARATEERRAAFIVKYADFLTLAATYAERSEFVADVIGKARARNEISGAQYDAVMNAIDRMKTDDARKAASRHVGTVGERIEFVGVVERIFEFSAPVFGAEWKSQTNYITTIRTADGAALVNKGRFIAEKDASVSGKATVKEHSEYRGEKQTVVQRVALTEQKRPFEAAA